MSCFQIQMSNWIFCHISNNGIFVCSSIQYTLQNGHNYLTSCQTESLVAYLIMEPWVLFHSKLWMLNWWTNWIFCLISHNGIFIKSYLSAWISGGFVWIFDQYGFQYRYEFKSCPFKVRLMSSWIFCHISHNAILFAVSFKATCHSSFVLSNPDVQLKLFLHISKWNLACSFI